MLWILGIITVLVLSGTVYYIVSDLMHIAETNDDGPSANLENLREETGGTVTEEEMAVFQSEGKNPFGQKKDLESLTDRDYREYIHGMSHQKVKADQKWGFYEINSTRIQWLLDGLEVAETQLTNPDIYRNILERWNNGDFSKADEDHNTIWKLQGGTIGAADGILSPEEEQTYINSKN